MWEVFIKMKYDYDSIVYKYGCNLVIYKRVTYKNNRYIYKYDKFIGDRSYCKFIMGNPRVIEKNSKVDTSGIKCKTEIDTIKAILNND